MLTSILEQLIALKLRETSARNWKIEWTDSLTVAGTADFSKKVIELSWPIAEKLMDQDPLLFNQILLHEVAHVIAGAKAGHGPVWQEAAKELGVYDLFIERSAE